ncbi:hypothetical protein EA473_21690 [Natrarchaeobius chitinivorans]|uniref:Uncharacterized protein n=1 Tax=Natrarchaeobius chitinivorans TaxID=1679083 RepID=A0A3N6P328_NATCH|nr:hypothetical protein EA473_21690 [Natrarchaeobius chitinivorans]
MVEFQGTVEPEQDTGAFESPFSGREAVCYEAWMKVKSRHRTDVDGVEVGGVKGMDKPSNTEVSWGLAESDEARRPFAVQDGGSRVMVDPTGAEIDITDHMGESVLTVGTGDSLSEDAHERLQTITEDKAGFESDAETWDREDETVKYQEARLEPGDTVHVIGAEVESVPDEWGHSIDATVTEAVSDDQFRISEGTESGIVRNQLIQFITGSIVATGLLLLSYPPLTRAGMI